MRGAVVFAALLAAAPLCAAPEESPRPAARATAESVPEATFRPEARPEVFEAALAAQLLARFERLEPVPPRADDPPEVVVAARAFAAASPQAVSRALRPAKRSEALVQKAMARQREVERGAVCGDPALQGERVGFVPGRLDACGMSDGVRLRAVSGIPLSQEALVDCTTAKALKRWVDRGLKPAIGQVGGGVEQIRVAAHYVCRTRNNQPGAEVSEHGKGRAIDISGFRLRDGSTITVLEGWNTEARGPLLRRMYRAACGTFGTTLGPDSDRYHQDHFHFDTARHRGGSYCGP